MKTAMLPGTFDPPTLGHLDIIRRSAKLFDRLYVVVAVNMNKQSMFSEEERVEMLSELLKDEENIEVVSYRGLVVDFARDNKVDVIVRGVRAQGDFSYEFELAMMNRQIYKDVEVLFIPTSPKYFLIRSSAIKEMARFGADISDMVPQLVIEKLKNK